MHFKENADVMTSRGRRVGRIDRVVVDPTNGEATHLVVKKGLLFRQDKVIPIERIEGTAENQVILKTGPDDEDAFPDFEEAEHIPVEGVEDFKRRETEHARRVIWYHTRINAPWWGDGAYPAYPKPLFVTKTRRNIPHGSVPLEEGAEVVDARGSALGRIEDVYAEPDEHQVTHLLISRGILSKKKKLIPSAWIKDLLEDSVRLTVEKKIIDALPDPARSSEEG